MQCVSIMLSLYRRRWHQYTFFSLSSPLCYHWYVFLFMMCIYIYIWYLISLIYHPSSISSFFSLCAPMWIVSTALSSVHRHLPYQSFLLCCWVFTINYSFQILYLPVIKFLNYSLFIISIFYDFCYIHIFFKLTKVFYNI